MAAKTFTITASGVEDGQQLDASTTSLLVRGNLNGGILQIEASNADSNYVFVTSTKDSLKVDAVNSITLPGGWYVRTRTIKGSAEPAITVVVE